MWKKLLVVLPVSASLVAAGCAPGAITRTLGLSDVPDSYDDRTDACYTERQALTLSDDYFAEELISVALAGGLVGTGVALAAGASVEESLLIGLVTAVGIGAAGTYWEYVVNNSGDDAETMFSAVNHDLRQENEEILRFEQRLSALTSCRKAQAGQINAQLAAGTINRETAETRMADVRASFREDITYAQLISDKLGARSDELVFASGQVNQMVTVDQTATRSPSVITASARQTANETEQAALSNQNARMNAEEFLEEDMLGALEAGGGFEVAA